MKSFRHAAALALVGWYLMAPPGFSAAPDAEVHINASAPLSEWDNLGSYDTAKECMDSKLRIEADVIAGKASGPKNAVAAAHTQIMAGQCIATDDPRLK